MKVVIVGGVAGGATAAARIRRLDENAEIIIFERSGYVSYANCGLPYYIGNTIEDPNALSLQTPESFWQRFRIRVNVRHEVVAIHPERKTVSVRSLTTDQIFEESYDKLLLAPGAKPIKPNFRGIDHPRLFTLRTVEDTLRIRRFVDEERPASVILTGGGYIGLELAHNLKERGLDVTLVQQLPQLMTPLDPEMASFVHNKLRQEGIKLLLNTTVTHIEDDHGQIRVCFENGESQTAHMAVLAIGVAPDSRLAKEAGLGLGMKGSILVNDHMETSVPDIYAAGDAVEVRSYVTGSPALISLAGPANRQGRIAADNICGKNSTYPGSQGSSVIKIFDMTVATTGLNEAAVKAEGLDYDKLYLSPANHATYYPGGQVMTMKILFEKNTWRLLGAQIIGYEGVDKRIDVLATAMYAKITGLQLKELDLAYAPPYSSAKDPVNMAGFIMENIAEGHLKQVFWEDMETRMESPAPATWLDVRMPMEYDAGHIEGFTHIPLDELRERIQEIPKGQPVYVMCQSGLRSYLACRILAQHGFDCFNFSGGFRLYAAVHSDRCAAKQALPCGMEI